MMGSNHLLAIIPARSGSKGLKNKNIRVLNGKPLIQYTIEAASNAGIFSDIVVTTDSLEYKEIAESAGAWVPYLRESSLANDTANITDVIADVFHRLNHDGYDYDSFMLLQPTSPLRNEINMIEAFDLFYEKEANAVVSLSEADHSPLWFNTLKSDLSINNFIKDIPVRRQDMEKYYRINGAIYLTKKDYYLKYRNFYHDKSYGYIMDKFSSVDIDDEYDFKFAEFLLNQEK